MSVCFKNDVTWCLGHSHFKTSISPFVFSFSSFFPFTSPQLVSLGQGPSRGVTTLDSLDHRSCLHGSPSFFIGDSLCLQSHRLCLHRSPLLLLRGPTPCSSWANALFFMGQRPALRVTACACTGHRPPSSAKAFVSRVTVCACTDHRSYFFVGQRPVLRGPTPCSSGLNSLVEPALGWTGFPVVVQLHPRPLHYHFTRALKLRSISAHVFSGSDSENSQLLLRTEPEVGINSLNQVF